VAAHQQVGEFQVVDQHGQLVKNGGNVATYFCTPDGRVVHATLGPVSPEELLAEARWAVQTFEPLQSASPDDQAAQMALAHRDAFEANTLSDGPDRPRRLHDLFAKNPLPPVKDVYRDIFEHILNEPLSVGQEAVQQAVQAVNQATQSRLPILFLLHKGRDSKPSLDQWKAVLERSETQGKGGLAALASGYVVIVLPIEDLPDLSHHLSIRPFAAPDQRLPLFVVSRSDARQLTAVTSWSQQPALTEAMALGLVQEAKEHTRTPKQLDRLRQLVEPINKNLTRDVADLVQEQEGG
jgi:hypothetical protein